MELKEDTLVSLVSFSIVLLEDDVLLIDSSMSANKRIESDDCRIKGPVAKMFLLIEAVAEAKAISTPLMVAFILYCLSIDPRLKLSPIEWTITGVGLEKTISSGLDPPVKVLSKSCSSMF